MTEQHYTVVADRDKGDDPKWEDVLTGDRATSRSIRVGDFSMVGSELVRIERPATNWTGLGSRSEDWKSRPAERPAPTTDMTAMSHETTGFCFCGEMHGRVKDWNEYDWTALRTHQPSPHPPTREQIAQAKCICSSERVAHEVSCPCWFPPHLGDALISPRHRLRAQISEAVCASVPWPWDRNDTAVQKITDAVLALFRKGGTDEY